MVVCGRVCLANRHPTGCVCLRCRVLTADMHTCICTRMCTCTRATHQKFTYTNAHAPIRSLKHACASDIFVLKRKTRCFPVRVSTNICVQTYKYLHTQMHVRVYAAPRLPTGAWRRSKLRWCPASTSTRLVLLFRSRVPIAKSNSTTVGR